MFFLHIPDFVFCYVRTNENFLHKLDESDICYLCKYMFNYLRY